MDIKPIHIVTLSGNSERFVKMGYPHKALCKVNKSTTLELFISCWGDFHQYETIFLCRSHDLKNTNLKNEITRLAPGSKIFGVEVNHNGPVYSISKIFSHIKDAEPVLISYIDTLQKTSISEMMSKLYDLDGGLTVHDFKNPHWRTNKNYCLVETNQNMKVTKVVEKYNFEKKDFSCPNKYGSSGNYFFKNGQIMKHYFNNLMQI
jgi:ADP-glucose pyrophosphorylase